MRRFFELKNITRTRREVSSLFQELGGYQERAYHMNIDQFNELHQQLLTKLQEQFTTKRKCGKSPSGIITTKLCLSAEIRYFAGGSPLDIMLTHGISRQSVYCSVWGTTDAVNAMLHLSFHQHGAELPSHNEQEEIAGGFKLRSKAEFDKVCLTVDGMLIWTVQPSTAEYERLRMGERQFHC